MANQRREWLSERPGFAGPRSNASRCGVVIKRREWLLAPLAYLVLVGFLYRTVWLAPEGKPRQYFGWDTPEAYWPDMAYFANSMSHGEAPLWNPYNRGGYAFYADLLP